MVSLIAVMPRFINAARQSSTGQKISDLSSRPVVLEVINSRSVPAPIARQLFSFYCHDVYAFLCDVYNAVLERKQEA